MKYLQRRIFYFMMLAFTTAAIVACSNEETSAKSEEPTAGSSGTWFNAHPIKAMYAAQIRMEAVESGKNNADTSCEAVLPLARKSLSDSGNGMVVQIMYKLCNNAGLKFQRKVRCGGDQLQVLCL